MPANLLLSTALARPAPQLRLTHVAYMALESARAKALIQTILSEVTESNGSAAIARFPTLRSVDAKFKELELILSESAATSLLERMKSDEDFLANSRRVRLEALANYCSTALRFFDGGLVTQKRSLFRGPNLSALTGSLPNLEPVIQERWLDAQKCQHAKAYLASVILMGSILEALLLARCSMSPGPAYQAKAAPRHKDGSSKAIHEWTLHNLIEVAVELRWLKSDRGRFSHALRESRNVVHPYEQARSGANFDEHTCKTSWHVLNASVEDLLASL